MSWKSFVEGYLTFSRKDRVAVIFVIVLIGIIYFLPRLFARPSSSIAVQEDTALLKIVDTLQASPKSHTDLSTDNATSLPYQYEPSPSNSYSEGALFTFDPNTLPTEGWQRLGLNQRTIRTINNYRSKGGRFYKPEDLKKIWGLPQGFYERVASYITIATENKRAYTTPYNTQRPEKKERTFSTIDINEADTTAFIALPGIGSKLAQRIITFREKLGGFYSVEQIGETYGLPDSTFQKLKPYFKIDEREIKKWNLNAATKDELKAHPYIRWNLANAIVEYRAQHGPYKSLQELKNIMLIDDATYQKIAPYFTIQ